MRTIKSLSRLGVVLASLAVVAVSLASSASASTTVIPVGGGSGAIRKHHAALGVDCGDVHRVDGIT